jgi:hypothetical protein
LFTSLSVAPYGFFGSAGSFQISTLLICHPCMTTVRNASSGTIAMKPPAFPAIADIRMACAASTAIKGSAITQASEAATKTSPMAKTDPW